MGRPKKEVSANATVSKLKAKYEYVTYYYCTKCGKKVKNIKDLIPSQSPLYAGTENRIPLCRDCMEDIFDYYAKLYDSLKMENVELLATKRICMMFDIYFDERIYASALKADSKNSLILAYIKNSNLMQYKGKTYDNTLDIEREQAQAVINNHEEVKDTENVKEETVKFFGTGFSEEDYIYLQEEYNDWTARHECKTKAQEEVFKRLCFKQLEILKATRAGVETKDLDYSFQQLLGTAKLQPKQNSADTMSESQVFGTLIDKWEETRPLPEIDDEIKDVDKIGLYIDVFFRGHLAKMLNIKNAFSNLYSKFISKYTVKKPEYEEDEDSEVIFDAIFGGSDKLLDD